MSLAHGLQGRLLFAVPKKGRLLQKTLDLLEGADIQFRRENRLDIALVKNLPIALLFLPAADIPTAVGEGRVDLGITGHDQVEEHNAEVRAREAGGAPRRSGEDEEEERPRGCETVMDLGFGSCRLQVQVPEAGPYEHSRDLIGKHIGTSFVQLTREYFARLELEAENGGAPSSNGDVDLAALARRELRTKIIKLSGSVEAACALGMADGIVDLVESGETMRAARLKAIDTVVETSAILIKSRRPSNPELVALIAARISGVITAQRYVLCTYNVERARLPEAERVTPGKRAPTVTALDEDGWVAVSVMVEKKKIAGVMDELVRVGAADVLVTAIANTRGC